MARTDFGKRLKAAFNNASNQEIANKIGVSAPAVQNYVSGRYPDGDKLLLIAAVTKCDLHWLMTGEIRKPLTGIEEVFETRMREIARQEIRNLRPQVSKPEEQYVTIEPADLILAPVVAKIDGGEETSEEPSLRKTG